MSSQKKQSPPNLDFQKLITGLHRIFVLPVVEFYYGYKMGTLPVYSCFLASAILQLSVLIKIDYFVIQKIGLGKLYPTGGFFAVYVFLISLGGFIGWAYLQVALRFKLTRKLTEVFTNSGLKNATGKFPNFIFDRPLDEYCRRLRLTRSNFPLKSFKTAKDHIASGLSVFIDDIKEDRPSGTVDIIYSHTMLTKDFRHENIKSIKKDRFVIGKSRGPVMEYSLNSVPHLLIAGCTGGGKSTFLRQLITGWYVNNPDYKFNLQDLKGGLEFQLFEGLKNVKVDCSISEALSTLDNLANKVIEDRKRLFKLNRCKDLEAFKKIPKEKILFPEGVNENPNIGRHIVVVDEAAELFMVGAYAKTKEVQEAKRNSNKIAAQGRALGVHIVIATQRPDRFAIDPLTKANLPGILCYPQPNLATSRTVLDSGRACDLPAEISGRAVWKYGNKLVEVQTPLFTEEDALKYLDQEKFKAKKDPKKKRKEIDESLY